MLWLLAPSRRGADDNEKPASASPRLAIASANTNFVYVVDKQHGAWRVSEKIKVAHAAPTRRHDSQFAFAESR